MTNFCHYQDPHTQRFAWRLISDRELVLFQKNQSFETLEDCLSDIARFQKEIEKASINPCYDNSKKAA